jgi:Arc/MetJ-type ribon-helix-helix transcriptional regulator
MPIGLSPEVEQQIDELVTSGRFASADECVRTCVAVFKHQEEDQKRHIAEMRAHGDEVRRLVAEGTAALERADHVDYDDESLKAFFEQVKRDGRDERRRVSAAS